MHLHFILTAGIFLSEFAANSEKNCFIDLILTREKLFSNINVNQLTLKCCSLIEILNSIISDD